MGQLQTATHRVTTRQLFDLDPLQGSQFAWAPGAVTIVQGVQAGSFETSADIPDPRRRVADLGIEGVDDGVRIAHRQQDAGPTCNALFRMSVAQNPFQF
jgi:hypothetical protein